MRTEVDRGGHGRDREGCKVSICELVERANLPSSQSASRRHVVRDAGDCCFVRSQGAKSL